MHLHLFTTAFAALFALAAGLPRDQQPVLFDPSTNRTISPTLFGELEELARIVDISYCVGTGTGLGIQKPFHCLGRCKEFSNFELVSVRYAPALSMRKFMLTDRRHGTLVC